MHRVGRVGRGLHELGRLRVPVQQLVGAAGVGAELRPRQLRPGHGAAGAVGGGGYLHGLCLIEGCTDGTLCSPSGVAADRLVPSVRAARGETARGSLDDRISCVPIYNIGAQAWREEVENRTRRYRY